LLPDLSTFGFCELLANIGLLFNSDPRKISFFIKAMEDREGKQSSNHLYVFEDDIADPSPEFTVKDWKKYFH